MSTLSPATVQWPGLPRPALMNAPSQDPNRALGQPLERGGWIVIVGWLIMKLNRVQLQTEFFSVALGTLLAVDGKGGRAAAEKTQFLNASSRVGQRTQAAAVEGGGTLESPAMAGRLLLITSRSPLAKWRSAPTVRKPWEGDRESHSFPQ